MITNIYRDERGRAYFHAGLEDDGEGGYLLTLWDYDAEFRVYLTDDQLDRLDSAVDRAERERQEASTDGN